MGKKKAAKKTGTRTASGPREGVPYVIIGGKLVEGKRKEKGNGQG